MFVRNFPFLFFLVMALGTSILACFKTRIDAFTWPLLILCTYLIAFVLVYAANLICIFLFGRSELEQRAEALWKERISAVLEKRLPIQPSRDLLDHAAALLFRFHSASYRLGLWHFGEEKHEMSRIC